MPTTMTTHKCYRCEPETDPAAAQRTARNDSTRRGPTGGDELFFASGYSAREIAQKHAREFGGHIYVNNVSRAIKRPELTVWVGVRRGEDTRLHDVRAR